MFIKAIHPNGMMQKWIDNALIIKKKNKYVVKNSRMGFSFINSSHEMLREGELYQMNHKKMEIHSLYRPYISHLS